MADSKEVSISAASVSDQAVSKDSLGFDLYVTAIAYFLTESETKPPLTLSVEGAWGSGKSSFMKQLEQKIASQSQEKRRSKLRKERTKYIDLLLPLIYASKFKQELERQKKLKRKLEINLSRDSSAGKKFRSQNSGVRGCLNSGSWLLASININLSRFTLLRRISMFKQQGYFILLVMLILLANEESENQATKGVLDWVLINLVRMKQPWFKQELKRQKLKRKLLQGRISIYVELNFIRNIRRKFRQSLRLKKFTGNLVGLCKEIFSSRYFDDFKEVLIDLVKVLINLLIVLAIPLIGIPFFILLALINALVNLCKIVALTRKIWFPHRPRVVWFNAWRHDKADALWAAFALTFLEEISKQRDWLDIFPTLCGHIKLLWLRFQQKEGELDLLRTFLQGLLAISAIVLIALFTFSPNSQWVNHLSSQVQQYTPSIGSTSSPSPSPSPSPSSKSPSSEASSTPEKKPGNFLSNLPSWLSKLPFWGAGSLAILTLWQRLQKIVGDPKKDLKEYLKAPKYDDQVSFIEKFHKDFKKIVNAYAGKGKKVYVFIDDLDRCDVPKSAELMQAINLMISNDPQLIFILGMDREKVAAGLAVKHKAVIPYLFSSVQTKPQTKSGQTQENQAALKGLEYGYTFIEKFVQLPFQVPRPAKAQFDQFLGSLSSPKQPQDSTWQARGNFFWKPIQKQSQRLIRWISPPSQDRQKRPGDSAETPEQPGKASVDQAVEKRLETLKIKIGPDSPEIHNILEMVAPALDWNPRRLKQFLNLFRLRAYIASATGLFDQIDGSPALTLEQLGKFTAIGVRWPLLMVELTRDEHLLANLQKHFLNPHRYSTTTYWGSEPQLLELFRDRASQPAYSLEHVNVQTLLQVSPQLYPLDRIPLKSKKGVDYQKLRDYLQNGQWREADQETYNVMLKAVGKEDFLDEDDLRNFPCQDLQTIDELWVAASKGKFGFSVQNRIWQACGGQPGVHSLEVFHKFAHRVGWCSQEGETLTYNPLVFDLTAPEGHLPAIRLRRHHDQGGFSLATLMWRLEGCGI